MTVRTVMLLKGLDELVTACMLFIGAAVLSSRAFSTCCGSQALSGMLKIVSTLLRRQCLGEPSDQFQEPRHGARRTLAQRRLQLRERLLDGIEIGRVGGQIP